MSPPLFFPTARRVVTRLTMLRRSCPSKHGGVILSRSSRRPGLPVFPFCTRPILSHPELELVYARWIAGAATHAISTAAPHERVTLFPAAAVPMMYVPTPASAPGSLVDAAAFWQSASPGVSSVIAAGRHGAAGPRARLYRKIGAET